MILAQTRLLVPKMWPSSRDAVSSIARLVMPLVKTAIYNMRRCDLLATGGETIIELQFSEFICALGCPALYRNLCVCVRGNNVILMNTDSNPLQTNQDRYNVPSAIRTRGNERKSSSKLALAGEKERVL